MSDTPLIPTHDLTVYTVLEDFGKQGIELRHAFVIEADHLGIENGNALDARRFLDDARVAVSPVGPVHRIETHPPIADMA